MVSALLRIKNRWTVKIYVSWKLRFKVSESLGWAVASDMVGFEEILNNRLDTTQGIMRNTANISSHSKREHTITILMASSVRITRIGNGLYSNSFFMSSPEKDRTSALLLF